MGGVARARERSSSVVSVVCIHECMRAIGSLRARQRWVAAPPKHARSARVHAHPSTGTGGSLLVIGSAAGVAFMSIEGAGFGWYLKRVTPWAVAGYGAALATYALLHGLPAEAPPV